MLLYQFYMQDENYNGRATDVKNVNLWQTAQSTKAERVLLLFFSCGCCWVFFLQMKSF